MKKRGRVSFSKPASSEKHAGSGVHDVVRLELFLKYFTLQKQLIT